jgi:urocanate hydratase
MGFSQHSELVTVAGGSDAGARRLERVHHADAG